MTEKEQSAGEYKSILDDDLDSSSKAENNASSVLKEDDEEYATNIPARLDKQDDDFDDDEDSGDGNNDVEEEEEEKDDRRSSGKKTDDEEKEEEKEDDDDDDDDDEVVRRPPRRIIEDDEDSEDEEEKVSKKRKIIFEDDEDDEDSDNEVAKVATSKNIDEDEEDGDDDDDDEDDDNDDKGADGDDDDDEDEDKNDEKSSEKKVDDEEKEEEEEEEEEEDDDDDDDRRQPRNGTIYDFDIMMAKKKEENSRRRKRKGYDIINDNDDIIADIINQMKDAVEADSEANKKKMAATRKLKLLPFVISQLRKVDLRDAFLDSDVLSVITEWLAPLPDRSLPHLHIRENLLKILIDFNLYDVDRIKSSGIGKAVMYLYKHPKESRENKQRAKQLISSWSRPIFQLDSSFTAISREEREQRDLELMSKQRRASKHNDSSDGEGPGPSSGQKRLKEEPGALKPGEKGWIPRARVPAPSMKDYVIRPRSKVDGDIGKNSKRPSNMLEKYMKNQQERRRASRQQRAINMKIDRV